MTKPAQLTLHIKPEIDNVSVDGKWAMASAKYWVEGEPGSDKVLYYSVPVTLRDRLHSSSDAWILVFLPFVMARKGKVVFHGIFHTNTMLLDALTKIAAALCRTGQACYRDCENYANGNFSWITDDGTGVNINSWPSRRAATGTGVPGVQYIGPNMGSMEAFRQDGGDGTSERVFIHGLHLPLDREVALNAAMRYYEGLNVFSRARLPVYYTLTNIRELYTDPAQLWMLRPVIEIAFGHIAGFTTQLINIYGNQSFTEGLSDDVLRNGFVERLFNSNSAPRMYMYALAYNMHDRFTQLGSGLLKVARHCMTPTDEYNACNKCLACSQLRMALNLHTTGVEDKAIFGAAKYPLIENLLAKMGPTVPLPNLTILDNLIISLVNSGDVASAEFVNAIIKVVTSKGYNSPAWAGERVAELTAQYAEFSQGKPVTLLTRATVFPK